jgi:hypothetical protein
MDTVLGVSMAPTAVQMVLVEGENGDGATVDQDNFDVAGEDDAATIGAADRVVAAILGTREGASEGGYQLTSTGVTWTDPIDAVALRDALAAHKVENVMLVSAFLAAAALAQAVGNEINYAHTALLFVEADTATLAVIDSADGSIADVHRHQLPDDDDAAVAELASIISGAEQLETRPNGVFVVGSGIDIPLIKPTLEAATSLPLSAPEEPETALARGAALASANAPLFVSTTAAQAWAQDPGTGVVDPFAITPGYYEVTTDAESGANLLAYSAVSDDFTGEYTAETTVFGDEDHEKKPFALLGSVLAAIFIVGVAALVVSLAIAIRPTAGVRPDPGHNVVAPAIQAPAAPAPAPEMAPAPAPVAPAPAPVPEASVQVVPQAPESAPIPAAPAPIPYVPPPAAPAPAPLPEAPAPVPVAPVAPIPVPIPIPLPIIGGPFGPHPGGGYPGGGGGYPGGGGGFPGGGHGGFGGGPFGGGHGGGGHGGFGHR